MYNNNSNVWVIIYNCSTMAIDETQKQSLAAAAHGLHLHGDHKEGAPCGIIVLYHVPHYNNVCTYDVGLSKFPFIYFYQMSFYWGSLQITQLLYIKWSATYIKIFWKTAFCFNTHLSNYSNWQFWIPHVLHITTLKFWVNKRTRYFSNNLNNAWNNVFHSLAKPWLVSSPQQHQMNLIEF